MGNKGIIDNSHLIYPISPTERFKIPTMQQYVITITNNNRNYKK